MKDSANAENQYNHNFDGVYCTCERPYPDPEDTVNDEMLQCVICEDWYHSRVRYTHNFLYVPHVYVTQRVCNFNSISSVKRVYQQMKLTKR